MVGGSVGMILISMCFVRLVLTSLVTSNKCLLQYLFFFSFFFLFSNSLFREASSHKI